MLLSSFVRRLHFLTALKAQINAKAAVNLRKVGSDFSESTDQVSNPGLSCSGGAEAGMSPSRQSGSNCFS